MTRDQIKARMTTAMEEIYNDDLCFEGQAAAVMALVGPKPLVWEEERGHEYVIFRAECPATKKKYCAGTDRNGSSYWGCDDLDRHQEIDSGGWAAAQAAAQSHADAAHWANTPLADLIGGAA
jgi:hypothetical protein